MRLIGVRDVLVTLHSVGFTWSCLSVCEHCGVETLHHLLDVILDLGSLKYLLLAFSLTENLVKVEALVFANVALESSFRWVSHLVQRVCGPLYTYLNMLVFDGHSVADVVESWVLALLAQHWSHPNCYFDVGQIWILGFLICRLCELSQEIRMLCGYNMRINILVRAFLLLREASGVWLFVGIPNWWLYLLKSFHFILLSKEINKFTI